MFGNLSGLFGGGNMAGLKPREGVTRTQSILGTLGDMLSTAGGGQATFLPGLRQRAMLEEQRGLQVQQGKQERDNAMQDWIARQQWERANPAPVQPTELQRNYDWLHQNNPNAAAAYLERMTNNYEYRQGADGRFYRIDIADAPAQMPPDSLPADFNFGAPPQAMSAPQGGRQSITVDNAGRIRASMPAGRAGDEQFANWLRNNNVQIGAF